MISPKIIAQEDASQNTITITMSVQDQAAVGLGFIVDHIKYGGSGQFFQVKGLKAKRILLDIVNNIKPEFRSIVEKGY